MTKAAKSGASYHAFCLLYEGKWKIKAEKIQEMLDDPDMVMATNDTKIPIPDYALDIHTRRANLLGRGGAEFMKMETEGLGPFR